VDVRDEYNEIRVKLGVLPQFFEQAGGVDELGVDAFVGGGVSEEILELYQDADEELADDAFVTGDSPSGTE
jgi:hypothetical protein